MGAMHLPEAEMRGPTSRSPAMKTEAVTVLGQRRKVAPPPMPPPLATTTPHPTAPMPPPPRRRRTRPPPSTEAMRCLPCEGQPHQCPPPPQQPQPSPWALAGPDRTAWLRQTLRMCSLPELQLLASRLGMDASTCMHEAAAIFMLEDAVPTEAIANEILSLIEGEEEDEDNDSGISSMSPCGVGDLTHTSTPSIVPATNAAESVRDGASNVEASNTGCLASNYLQTHDGSNCASLVRLPAGKGPEAFEAGHIQSPPNMAMKGRDQSRRASVDDIHGNGPSATKLGPSFVRQGSAPVYSKLAPPPPPRRALSPGAASCGDANAQVPPPPRRMMSSDDPSRSLVGRVRPPPRRAMSQEAASNLIRHVRPPPRRQLPNDAIGCSGEESVKHSMGSTTPQILDGSVDEKAGSDCVIHTPMNMGENKGEIEAPVSRTPSPPPPPPLRKAFPSTEEDDNAILTKSSSYEHSLEQIDEMVASISDAIRDEDAKMKAKIQARYQDYLTQQYKAKDDASMSSASPYQQHLKALTKGDKRDIGGRDGNGRKKSENKSSRRRRSKSTPRRSNPQDSGDDKDASTIAERTSSLVADLKGYISEME